MRWIVTGCHGFLGTSFGRYATGRGDEVLGIARGSQPPLGWRGKYLSADVGASELADCFGSFQPEAIFHAAGSASVAGSFRSPHDDFRASVGAWSHVLDAVRRSGTRPLVFFPSSAAVYGQPDVLPVSENASLRPMSPYGYHKMACEVLAESHARFFDTRIIIIRIFSLFGALQRRLLLWEIFQQIRNGVERVELAGSGAETRDFLSVDDLSGAVHALAALPKGTLPALAVFNVAAGVELDIVKVAETVARLSGNVMPVHCRGESRSGDPDRWVADTKLLRQALSDWEPRPFETALAETISAWKA